MGKKFKKIAVGYTDEEKEQAELCLLIIVARRVLGDIEIGEIGTVEGLEGWQAFYKYVNCFSLPMITEMDKESIKDTKQTLLAIIDKYGKERVRD